MNKKNVKQLELLDAQMLGYMMAKNGYNLSDLLIEAGVETIAELQEYKKSFDILPQIRDIVFREIQSLKELLELRKKDYENFGVYADDLEMDNNIRFKIKLLKELIKN